MKNISCLFLVAGLFLTTACSNENSGASDIPENAYLDESVDPVRMENEERSHELISRLRRTYNNHGDGFPDYFGGYYLNEEGLLVVNVTERNAEIDQNIKDAIESDEVIFKEVEFSLQTLNEIMEELDEIWLSTPKDELVQNITEYGIDIIANSITIGLEDDSEAQIQHFKDNILDHSAIQFEQREPVVLE